MNGSMTPGANVPLTAERPGLSLVRIGLGWNFPEGTVPFDLDASALLVQPNGKLRGDDDLVFYNNPSDPALSVHYGGDNTDGAGEGDDERLTVRLDRVPAEISKVVICATIHDAEDKHFGLVDGAYIRLQNLEDGEELARFELQRDFNEVTAMLFGELYRHNGAWKFRALGMGFKGGLEAVVTNFGVQVS
ncbi:TerD family protein [Deinococcus radiopugnans]|uniref:Tellurium resistance protein TerD n=1 Tax=Deinococcus radiopugnans ATCC 19172 TaxID=585398 RepID=A0A5C4XUX1_9DEIO|nr:TerD family protein [Deinococcus radiopugnans]MBB6018637.1 tellurium resistance protein TerD [Deinococcus radiopugnans ATCC 19172]TNM67048.1 TerD family protein [Deinococcus radiopugnans ATCC 19172]